MQELGGEATCKQLSLRSGGSSAHYNGSMIQLARRVQVRRMIQSGELAALKVGREYRIPLVALEAFVQAALE